MKVLKEDFKVALLIILLISPIVIWANWPRTHHAYFTTGPIQGLYNKNEVWLFFQYPHMVQRPGIAWDAPTLYPDGHKQELVIIDKSGLKKRIPLSIKNGISFHKNLSEIFAGTDGTYLYYPPSRDTQRSIFKWENDHFKLLPLNKSEIIFENMDTISLKSFREITTKNGWAKATEEDSYLPLYFKWNGLHVRLFATESSKKNFEVNIEITGEEQNIHPIILQHSREYETYKGKRKTTSQQGHRK